MADKKQMTTTQTFLGGIVIGFLLLSTIGFFIMLGVYFGDDEKEVSADSGTEIVADDVVQPTEPTTAPDINVKAVDENVDHIRGNKDAKITLIEYSDIECPFCKRFHNTTLQVFDEYSEDVRLVFRHFPLDMLHKNARAEANATECAAEQGKFWEMLDLIFEETLSNDGLDLDKLPDYAKSLGLNVSQFSSCVEEQKYADKVKADEKSGVDAGAQGTPYSVLVGPDGEVVPISGAQPFESVSAAIESFL